MIRIISKYEDKPKHILSMVQHGYYKCAICLNSLIFKSALTLVRCLTWVETFIHSVSQVPHQYNAG